MKKNKEDDMQKKEICVRRDYKSTGNLNRYVFGIPGKSCSGAVWISPEEDLPCVIFLKVPKEGENVNTIKLQQED